MDRVVRIDGRPVPYLAAGTGPAVVLLHGLGESSADWAAVLARLSRSRAVYAPALPGFDGQGGAGDVSADGHARFVGRFHDAVGLQRAALVGHSLGGLAALLFALAAPERVTALCLVGGGGLGREVSPALATLSEPLLGEAEQYRLARRPGFLDAALAALRDQVGSTGQRRVLLERLRGLRVPVLLVWGGQDRVVPVAQARRAAARLPDAEVLVLSGSGHLPHVEDPEAFSRALLGFLDQADRPTGPTRDNG